MVVCAAVVTVTRGSANLQHHPNYAAVGLRLLRYTNTIRWACFSLLSPLQALHNSHVFLSTSHENYINYISWICMDHACPALFPLSLLLLLQPPHMSLGWDLQRARPNLEAHCPRNPITGNAATPMSCFFYPWSIKSIALCTVNISPSSQSFCHLVHVKLCSNRAWAAVHT